MLPPVGMAVQQQQTAPGGVGEKASERLKRLQEERAIEQEMRKLDDDYRVQAELKEAYAENARAINLNALPVRCYSFPD